MILLPLLASYIGNFAVGLDDDSKLYEEAEKADEVWFLPGPLVGQVDARWK